MEKQKTEERLISFSVGIIELSEKIKPTKAGNHLSGQLVRSGTAVSLNFAESQSSESRNDFIHKIKVVLKELRETHICLQILQKANLITPNRTFEKSIAENNELIAIFVASVNTAVKNRDQENLR